jgi:hypothetical protein
MIRAERNEFGVFDLEDPVVRERISFEGISSTTDLPLDDLIETSFGSFFEFHRRFVDVTMNAVRSILSMVNADHKHYSKLLFSRVEKDSDLEIGLALLIISENELKLPRRIIERIFVVLVEIAELRGIVNEPQDLLDLILSIVAVISVNNSAKLRDIENIIGVVKLDVIIIIVGIRAVVNQNRFHDAISSW